ncbi:MAG: DUF4124 domain-containing protein [Gallionella sp.]
MPDKITDYANIQPTFQANLPVRPPGSRGKTAGYRSGFFLALAVGITFSLPASAKLYKWVDNDGVTHYDEVVPPEYANKSRVELNKDGRVVKDQAILTPEQRLSKDQADAKKHAEEQLATDQQRHDKTLINTYSNTQEIDLARQRSLQQIDARINVISTSIKSASDNLAGLQNEADGYVKRNREIPGSLQTDLQNARARLDKLNKDMEKPLAEKAAIDTRYAADKARYIELTGKK